MTLLASPLWLSAEELDRKSASALKPIMALSEAELLRCVPSRNPLVYAANPVTLEYPGQFREWEWDPKDPLRVIDKKTGMKFPNPAYPEDKSFTVLNTLGQEVTIPYYQGKKPKPPFNARKGVERQRKQHPDRYLFSYAAANMQYGFMMGAIGRLKTAYEITGEDQYARRLALILYDFGQKLEHFPMLENNAQHGGKFPVSTGGPWMRDGKPFGKPGQDLPYKDWLSAFLTRKGFWGETGPARQFAEALVAISDSSAVKQLSAELGVDVAEEIEKKPIRFLVDHVIQYPWKGAHLQNNLQGYVPQIGDIGKLIGEPEYVHFVYQWVIKSPYYYDVTHDGLTGGGAAYGTGVSFLQKALYLHGYSDPEGFVSKVDGTHLQDIDIIKTMPFIHRLGYAKELLRYPNGDLVPAHDRNYNEYYPGWRHGGGVKLYPTPLPKSENHILAGFGHALLGDGVGEEQSQAHLHYSRAAEHPHRDCNSLALFAHGREMVSDLGYFHHPLRWWSGGTHSHNLVVIDEVDQNLEMSKGQLELCVTDWPGIALACSEGKRAYRGIAKKYRRTILHNTRDLSHPYVIDIFEVEGGSQHDWLLHGSASPIHKQQGNTSLPMEKMSGAHPLSNGADVKRDDYGYSQEDPFHMWGNVSRGVADRIFTVDFRYQDKPAMGTRTAFPAQANTEVFLGETISMRTKQLMLREKTGYKDNYQEKMPHLILRRKGENLKSLFIAVHEMRDGKTSITNFRQIDAGSDAVALEIEVGERKDIFFYSLNGETSFSHAGVTFNGIVGFASVMGDAVDAYMLGGTELNYQGRSLLSSEQSKYTGTLRDTRRRNGGDDATAFITDAELPPGKTLHGNWLHLTFDCHWKIGELGLKEFIGVEGDEPITTAYQIDYIETRDGKTWIHLLDGEHGLVMKEGKISELFLGRRAYDEAGTFVIYSEARNVPDSVQIEPGYPPTYTFSEVPFVPFAGSRTISLNSSKDAVIHYTSDGSTPSTSSPVYEGPFKINRDTTVKAIAVHDSMLMSPRVDRVTYKAALPAKSVSGLKPGLNLYLYEPSTEKVHTLPRKQYVEHCLEIGSSEDLPVQKSGTVENLRLVDGLYAAKQRSGYHGYIKVPQDAIYTFHIFVNPGATLAIDGQILHNKRRIGMSGIWKESIALQAGHHEIKLLYADNTIKEPPGVIDIKWQYGDHTKPEVIPARWLFRQE